MEIENQSIELTIDERPSDSPYVETIWRSHSGEGGSLLSIAAKSTDRPCPPLGAAPFLAFHRLNAWLSLSNPARPLRNSILDTVELAGYYDQPHLTKSLRRLIGQTPTQLLAKDTATQLSFLSNTE